MNTGKRVMRFDSVPYDLNERIRKAERKIERCRTDSAGRRAKGQGGAQEARQRMIDRMGKHVQQPLTPGRAYELFTAGSGADEARRRMIDRLQKKGGAR